jgi:branched-chain amino acid transport system permease protein
MKAAAPVGRGARAVRASGPLARFWPWLVLVAVACALPWAFYDFAHHRHSGFVVSMLSQMGLMVIFALSFNMLLGQAGLLSFGHAIFFGFGGYVAAHLLNGIGAGDLALPIELVPLAAGVIGIAFSAVLGYMATRQRATAFAMITMGMGELITVSAMMFRAFFGGEGGITTDRMVDNSIFGLSYAHGIQVYYLIVAWTVISVLAMAFLTATPLGRMANACRDNHERAQFVGYDPKAVRFIQFVLSGFFAAIGGGLFAITYEIVTFDAVAAPLSANALLMAYIGGSTVFAGPILGAVLITLLQSGLSLLSNAWLVYVGILFIAMVMFAPGGLSGIILAHRPMARAGRLGRLGVPYLRMVLPALATIFGLVAVVELLSFLTIGEAAGRKLVLFGGSIDVHQATPWIVAAVCLLGGGVWLRREGRAFHRAWEAITADLKAAGSA